MAGEQQQFFLKWNDFQSNMVTSFKHLRDEKSFTDVTLACDGQTCKAHKMVLSACSPYFKSLLEKSAAEAHRLFVEAYGEATLSLKSLGTVRLTSKTKTVAEGRNKDAELKALLEGDLCQTQEFLQMTHENPSKHPIIILKDVAYSHLQAILEFMYAGEVNVSQDQLPAFLKTADRLKVKGLAEAPGAIKREG